MIFNPFNWLALTRAFYVFVRPLEFALAIVRGQALPEVVVRTPTGNVRVRLRNYESLKTCFSVFCRGDYATPAGSPMTFLDVGANIGIASLYFLSRNSANRIICFEPDQGNLEFLRRNLDQYAERSTICAWALGTTAGTVTLFRAADGKYSSLLPSSRACLPDEIECRVFADALRDFTPLDSPATVKLDVEGLEPELVRSVDWSDFPRIRRLLCESTECAASIGRRHSLLLRNGYVEDVTFEDN